MPMREDNLCVVCGKNKAVGHDVCWQCRTPNNLIKSFYDDDTIEWNEEMGYRALLLAVAYVGTPRFKEMFDRQVETKRKKYQPKGYSNVDGMKGSMEVCKELNIDKNYLFRILYRLKIEGTRFRRQYCYTPTQFEMIKREVENAPPKKQYTKRPKNPTPQFDEVL